MGNEIEFTVFTKPWKQPLDEVGAFLNRLGFDGVELPVRPGFQVEPENVTDGLPEAAKVLEAYDQRIASVAGPTDEATIAACGEAGVPVIRICVSVPQDSGYFAAVEGCQRQWDGLVPLLDRHGVTLGIQNHCNRCIANAMQLWHAISRYDPRHVAAVWDPGHCAVDGEVPELALDILEDHLCMVNLKNPSYRDVAPEGAGRAEWKLSWTTGRRGLADWARVAALLKARGWVGPVCLTAEYSGHDAVDGLIADDIAFARDCFADG